MADTSVSYKCPNCGAPLSFKPGAKKIKCDYCDATFTIKDIEKLYAQREKAAEKAAQVKAVEWDAAAAGADWAKGEADHMQSFVCSSCGAEIVSDGNTIATECCYCGNPVMIPQRFTGMLKPDYVIPFKKTKAEAVEALKAFYQNKRLLPAEFTANNRVENIQGLYVPFWLFDSQAEASATFRGAMVNSYDTATERVTETSYYECYRQGRAEFNKIPADGSKKMADDFMDAIEPFDYTELCPFTTAYLTGFLADKYDVPAEECLGRVNERVEKSISEEVASTLGAFSNISLVDDKVTRTGGDIKYVLAPVWILTTRYKEKPYTFMMNGQTGKFIGRLPIDKDRERLYGWGTFGGVFVAAMVVMMLLLKFIP